MSPRNVAVHPKRAQQVLDSHEKVWRRRYCRHLVVCHPSLAVEEPPEKPRALRVPERSWLDHVPEVVSRDADTYRQFVVTLSRGFVRGVQQLPARRRELHDAIEKLEAGFLDLPQVERLMERNPVAHPQVRSAYNLVTSIRGAEEPVLRSHLEKAPTTTAPQTLRC